MAIPKWRVYDYTITSSQPIDSIFYGTGRKVSLIALSYNNGLTWASWGLFLNTNLENASVRFYSLHNFGFLGLKENILEVATTPAIIAEEEENDDSNVDDIFLASHVTTGIDRNIWKNYIIFKVSDVNRDFLSVADYDALFVSSGNSLEVKYYDTNQTLMDAYPVNGSFAFIQEDYLEDQTNENKDKSIAVVIGIIITIIFLMLHIKIFLGKE